MNSKEIKEALEIIKKPITVNCIEYKYFDDENYNKLIEVYDNCLWFANNLEQINLIVENFEKENQQLKEKFDCDLKWAFKCDELTKESKQLKEQLKQKEDVINKVKEIIDKFYVCNNFVVYDNNDITKAIIKLEEILDNKGE